MFDAKKKMEELQKQRDENMQIIAKLQENLRNALRSQDRIEGALWLAQEVMTEEESKEPEEAGEEVE